MLNGTYSKEGKWTKSSKITHTFNPGPGNLSSRNLSQKYNCKSITYELKILFAALPVKAEDWKNSMFINRGQE